MRNPENQNNFVVFTPKRIYVLKNSKMVLIANKRNGNIYQGQVAYFSDTVTAIPHFSSALYTQDEKSLDIDNWKEYSYQNVVDILKELNNAN